MASDLMFELPLETDRRRKERRGRRRKPIHILELPHEVLLTILDFSCQSPTELVRFSLVCSLFHRFTEAEPLWRKVCMNSFDSIHPLTLSRSGSWKSLLKNKALIENSPWTIKPKEAVQTLHNELLGVTSMAVDSRFIVCGGGTFDEPFEMCALFVERTVNVYDRKTFQLVENLHSHLGTVLGVELFDNYLMACGGGGRARMWKYMPESGRWEFRRTFKGHERSVFCVKFNKRTAVTASRDGALKIWDFRSATALRTINAHTKAINGMDWDGRRIATAGQDQVLRVWNVESGECTDALRSDKWFYCTQLKDNLVMTGGEGKVRLWDLRSGETVRKYSCNFSFPPAWITCLKFDENKVVAGSFNRNAYVWDFGSGRLINRWTAHEDKLSALHLDGTSLFTASRDRSVKQWEFDTDPILPLSPQSSPRRANCSFM